MKEQKKQENRGKRKKKILVRVKYFDLLKSSDIYN